MQLGSTPATAVLTTRARGSAFNSFAIPGDATARTAAPSLMPLEVPAVTLPSF
jgi:hypothetical protein